MVCASLSQWSVQVYAGEGGLCQFKSLSLLALSVLGGGGGGGGGGALSRKLTLQLRTRLK